MRVLVTGAAGFVGRHAVLALQSAGHDVVAVTRRATKSPALETIQADLLVPGAAAAIASQAKADALLHLAWATKHGVYWNDPANLNWVAASIELSAAMIASGTRRICGVGTCFEYAWPTDGDCDEFETGIAHHTLYDTAKDAYRRLLSHFATEQGLSFAWARLFHLYGPAEHPDRLVSSICRSLIAEQPARCSSGVVLRDFMDVRDAGAAVAALAVSDVNGPVNIASGEAMPIRRIAETLGEIAGRSDLVHLGAIHDRPNDPPRISANIHRLNHEVGYVTNRRLRDGLSDALGFWRSHP